MMIIAGLVLTSGILYAEENISAIRKSVIEIEATAQIADYSVPWNPGRISSMTGTGFLIDGGQILTNAHVAGNARFITVQKEGDSRKYEARIKYIAHDCDLSLLEVIDPSFIQGMQPLRLGGIPALDSTVSVLGYPIGGDRLSVTRGVVSRIDFQVYSHSGVDSHLAIQIDAAINPGNSGGPVMQNNRVVGVAFQGYSGDVAQGVGYMIPVPVISRFMQDIKDGTYDRYVDLGIYIFPLLNRAHRRALAITDGDFGVMVSSVIKAGAAHGLVKEKDVLLSIDGRKIFSSGHVEIDGETVHMAEVVERKFKGDTVKLDLVRNGKTMQVTVPLNLPWPYLMQARRPGARPRFVLFAGLVFQPLSNPFIEANNVKNVDILYHYSYFLDKEIYLERPEVIILSRILPDPINTYIQNMTHSIIDTINDTKIRTLEDAAKAFQTPSDYYVIKLLGMGRPIVLERKAVQEARPRILQRYGVISEAYLKDSIVPENYDTRQSD